MAVKAGLFVESFTGAKRPTTTFSGTVKAEGVAASRVIYGYKNNNQDISFETKSDSSGNWSLEIPLGATETARIVCVGEVGENSQVYEHLAE